MNLSLQNALQGGSVVESIARRTTDIPGDWAGRAQSISAQKIAPALQRQLDVEADIRNAG